MAAPVTAAPAAALAPRARPWLASARAAAPVPHSPGAYGPGTTYFLDVNHFARDTGWLHAAMLAYAADGAIALFVIMLAGGWLLARHRQNAAAMAASLWAGIGTVVAVALARPVDHAVSEARPWQSLPHALILARHSTGFAFPSGHATMAGAAIAGILLYSRRLGITALVLGLLLAFGRVYIGADYPQDVACGLALGAVVAGLGWMIIRVPATWLVRHLTRTRLRVLLTTGPAMGEPIGRYASGQRGVASRRAGGI